LNHLREKINSGLMCGFGACSEVLGYVAISVLLQELGQLVDFETIAQALWHRDAYFIK
jgi:hypothetical protein